MNDKQENRLSMAKAVLELLTANVALLPPATVARTADLKAAVNDIDAKAKEQSRQTGGAGKTKIQSELAAVNAAMVIIGAVQSYAKFTNNNVLQSETDYSHSDLSYLRDTTLANTLDQIATTVQKELPALADYEITAATITSFRALIKNYRDVLSAPKLAIGARSAATKALEPAFATLMSITTQLDGLMEVKKTANAELYTKYLSARTVGDNLHKKKKTQ